VKFYCYLNFSFKQKRHKEVHINDYGPRCLRNGLKSIVISARVLSHDLGCFVANLSLLVRFNHLLLHFSMSRFLVGSICRDS